MTWRLASNWPHHAAALRTLGNTVVCLRVEDLSLEPLQVKGLLTLGAVAALKTAVGLHNPMDQSEESINSIDQSEESISDITPPRPQSLLLQQQKISNISAVPVHIFPSSCCYLTFIAMVMSCTVYLQSLFSMPP